MPCDVRDTRSRIARPASSRSRWVCQTWPPAASSGSRTTPPGDRAAALGVRRPSLRAMRACSAMFYALLTAARAPLGALSSHARPAPPCASAIGIPRVAPKRVPHDAIAEAIAGGSDAQAMRQSLSGNHRGGPDPACRDGLRRRQASGIFPFSPRMRRFARASDGASYSLTGAHGCEHARVSAIKGGRSCAAAPSPLAFSRFPS